MKKLYRKGTIHPSPEIKSNENLLSLLPFALFSLAAVLSPEDREVLAYLISTASYSGDRNPTSRLKKTKPKPKKTRLDNHSPLFHCDCFSCYTSYWVRWDLSPSRQLIHEILDAFEDSLEKTKKKKNKKDRRRRSNSSKNNMESPSRDSESVVSSCPCPSTSVVVGENSGGCNGGGKEVEEVKGSVRRLLCFIGEKVFGVWG